MFRYLQRSKLLQQQFWISLRPNAARPFTRCYEKRFVSTVSQYFWNIFGFSYFVLAVAPVSVKKSDFKLKEIKMAITQSDDHFAMGKFEESYKVLLPFKDSNDVEILWRISRGLYNMSKTEQDKILKKKYVYDAHEIIDSAMKLNDNHFAVHKWMAILIDAKSSFEGIKARLLTLETFKKHLQVAMDLNPKDATSIYMLGHYCYSIAEMPWYQRQIASTLFAKPPVATFEEALNYFQKAEEVEPNFYSLNLLLLGKTCMKLNQPDRAKYWLQCASNYPVRTEEDREVRQEANELLQKFKK